MPKIIGRIPPYYVLLAFLAGSVLAGFSVHRVMPGPSTPPPAPAAVPPAQHPTCEVRNVRLRGYAGIEPLLMTERECESPRLADLKANLTDMVRRYQADSTLLNASVYLRDLERGDWMVVNDGDRFDPGSLLKVTIMMTYLRAAESDPKIMSATYGLGGLPPGMPKPFFPPAHPIALQQGYTVRDLIHRSIANSDNLANLALIEHMDKHMFERIFKDLALPDLDLNMAHYPMSTRDYSMFMRVLFNASYLSIRDSEFAMAQLAACDFGAGLRAGVPDAVKMAHKFGESGDGQQFQLHESAIVYLGDTPYLLTVMTKGREMAKLPNVLKSISELVYNNMSQRKS